MVKLRARLYKVALVRWADVPKAAVDALNLPPADIKGAIKGWNALLRFNADLDRVTLFNSSKRGHYKVAFKVELLKAAGVRSSLATAAFGTSTQRTIATL